MKINDYKKLLSYANYNYQGFSTYKNLANANYFSYNIDYTELKLVPFNSKWFLQLCIYDSFNYYNFLDEKYEKELDLKFCLIDVFTASETFLKEVELLKYDKN